MKLNDFIYHDQQSLHNIRKDSLNQDEKDQALLKAAKHFESIFLKMMLKSMRSANDVFAKGGIFDSQQHKFYQEMYDDQLALTLSAGNGLGLAEVMVKQLSHKPPPSPNPTSSLEDISRIQNSAKVIGNDSLHNQNDKNYQAENTLNQLLSSVDSINDVSGGNKKNEPNSLTFKESDSVHTLLHNESRESLIKSSMRETVIEPGSTIESKENTNRFIKKENNINNIHEPPPKTFNTPMEFIEKMKPYAEKAASVLGISPLYMIAQAALETGWGKFIMDKQQGESSYNLFGIKADSRWQGEIAVKSTVEFENDVAVKKRAKFRAYEGFEHSFNDYASFLKQNPRYENALKSTHDPGQYFTELQKSGYATDPNYANKILNILKSTPMQSNFSGSEFLLP